MRVLRPTRYFACTISAGNSLSSMIHMDGETVLAGLLMPGSWTAAPVSFQAQDREGGSARDIYDEAGELVIATAAASRYIVLNPCMFMPFDYIAIRSGTSAAPVAQTSSRTIYLLGVMPC